MADIELVVKIPEVEYEHLTNKEKFYSLEKNKQEWLINKILNRVIDGTSLPKGHGKLIDVKDLRLDIIAHKYSNSFCEEHNIDQSINVGMLNILLADAPTIIEADKGESDE